MPKATSLFAATTLVVAVVAAYLWQQLDAERERGVQLQARVAELESRPPVLLPAPAPLPQPSAPEQPKPETPAPASGNAKPATAAAQQVAPIYLDNELTRDPEFCKLQKAQMQLAIPRALPDVDTELGLSPSEYEAFVALLVRQQESAPGNPCGTAGNTRPTPESLQALQQSQRAEIEALLGSARYGQWEEYQTTLEGRVRVNQLRSTMSTSGTPLTDAQLQPLLATVLAEQKRRKVETEARNYATTDPRARLEMEEQNLRILEESYKRIQEASLAYLAPEQHAVMKNSQDQQLLSQRAMLRNRRAQLDAGINPQPAMPPVAQPQ